MSTSIQTPNADPSNPDNTPSTPLASNQDATNASNTQPAPAPVQQPAQVAPAQAAQPSTPALASNAPAPAPAQAHPVASRVREVAQILAGGPRYNTVIDANGNTTRTPIPISKSHIGMAIALEALSGSLAGLGARGTNATGQAAGAGLQQGQQIAAQRTAAQQYQDQQAQQDAKNRSDAIVRAASNLEVNSRTSLNTSQSERMGVESLKDAVSQNADLLQNYDDAGQVQESHVSQDDLMAGMQGKNPKYSALNQLAIPDGFTNINGKYEQTFSIVQNPNAKVPLTPEQARAFGDAGVQGFLPYADGKTVLGTDAQVPGTVIARANAQLHANNLMLQDAQSVQTALANSKDPATQELAKSIPDFKALEKDPNNGPVFQSALAKFQRYISHSDQHGMSFAESLAQMAQPSIPDPNKPGSFKPNPDAGAAQVIYGAFGNGNPNRGKAILQAYHDETAPTPIKDLNEANSILADQTSTARERLAASTFIKNTQAQKVQVAGAEARAKKAVEGTGTDNNTVAELGEAIAAGTLTEDQIPGFAKLKPQVQAYLAAHHPNLDQRSLFRTGADYNRAHLAQVATTNLDIIQSTLNRRPDLVGKINGLVSQGKELTGTNDPDLSAVAQALDNYTNASVGAHNMRSATARHDAKTALLNGFKNGPQGINGAINASRTSLNELIHPTPMSVNGTPYIVTSRPPTPGQVIDAGTVQKYIKKYGNANAARAAAQKDGWTIPSANGGK